MATEYDEDVRENHFFQKVRKKYNSVAQEGWIICVPRRGTFLENLLTDDDLLQHILIPQGDLVNNADCCYRTLNGKDVSLTDKIVRIKSGVTETCSHLLFEETFYEQDLSKYRVWCLERPLCIQNVHVDAHTPTNIHDVACTNLNPVTNLREAVEFLWMETSQKRLLTDLTSLIETFEYNQPNFEEQSIQVQRDLLGSLYAASLDLLLTDDRLRRLTSNNEQSQKNLKLSLETYLLYSLRDNISRSLSTCTGEADGKLNKILRNLSELDSSEFRVRADLYDRVGVASVKLSRLDRFVTVLEKTECLKRSVHYLSQGLPSISSDDLLPALVFLIIGTGLPNWTAQLTFLKYFRFSVPFLCGADEASFLITSLEAAIEYLRYNRISLEHDRHRHRHRNRNRNRNRQRSYGRQRYWNKEADGQVIKQEEKEEEEKENAPEDEEQEEQEGEEKYNEQEERERNTCSKRLFKSIQAGDLSEVKKIHSNEPILNRKTDIYKIAFAFCHPLCICNDCEDRRRQEHQSDNNTATIARWRSQKGFTTIHVAALYDRRNMIQFLVNLDSEAIDLKDQDGRTALHWASVKGYRDTIVTLLSLNANPNLTDLREDTPLHLAVEYGHQDCVQILLEHVDPNPVNINGDTPLHRASKWGYREIVGILSSYGGNPNLTNKKRETAITVAHNKHVLDLLTNVITEPNVRTILPRRRPPESIDSSPSDAEITALTRMTTGTETISEKSRTERVLGKLFAAITAEDTCLACYYLGLENRRGEAVTRSNKSCHPLCDCETCCLPGNDQEDKVIRLCTEKRRRRREVLGINTCNRAGETALHVASAAGSTEMVRILLDAGANVNARTEYEQRTALHLACLCGNVHVAALLLNCGSCELNARDRNHDTPLHFAIKNADPKLVKLLVRCGANTKLRNVRGTSPFRLLEEQVSKDTFSVPLLEISNILKRSSFENTQYGV